MAKKTPSPKKVLVEPEPIKDKPPIWSTNYFAIWSVILLMTFLTVCVMTARILGGGYRSYDVTAEPLITILLFLAFSFSYLIGLLRDNRKLVYWTGVVQFFILLLPLLTFDASPPYLPYSITPVFMLSFPILWVLLPLGLMYSMGRKSQGKFILELLLLSIVMLVIWFTKMQLNILGYLLLGTMVAVPLIIWSLVYWHHHEVKKKTQPRKEHSVLYLLILVFAILITGYILVWASSPSRSPPLYVTCGDGYCDVIAGEDAYYCPLDCREEPEETSVILSLNEKPACDLTVKLYNSRSELLRTIRGSKTDYSFDFGVEEDSVYFVVADSYRHTITTATLELEEGENSVDVQLDERMCEAPEPPTILRLIVKDASTNMNLDGVKVSIAEMVNGIPANYEVHDVTVNTLRDFMLTLNKTYALFVEKEGYEPYDGSTDIFTLTHSPVAKTIQLTPLEA